jgi:hypothetical protein
MAQTTFDCYYIITLMHHYSLFTFHLTSTPPFGLVPPPLLHTLSLHISLPLYLSVLSHPLHPSTLAIALNPQYAKAYIRRADSYYSLGGKENLLKSINDYQKALEFQTDEKGTESLNSKIKKVRQKVISHIFELLLPYLFYFLCNNSSDILLFILPITG